MEELHVMLVLGSFGWWSGLIPGGTWQQPKDIMAWWHMTITWCQHEIPTCEDDPWQVEMTLLVSQVNACQVTHGRWPSKICGKMIGCKYWLATIVDVENIMAGDEDMVGPILGYWGTNQLKCSFLCKSMNLVSSEMWKAQHCSDVVENMQHGSQRLVNVQDRW